ncbi:hypothetical protein Glove_173g10 [Diversispora epigaea]|uniref:DUF4209 domain-containing protein n=1 Tax=Diversispora epigaea TaxID=1348612 RepID=A0A397IYM4_9GLOM|nr:hypothetical protein Glove_173g10 [Diversispora epigaea]
MSKPTFSASNSNNPFIKSFLLGKSEQLSVENYMNFWQSCLGDHAKMMILIDDDDDDDEELSVESNYVKDYKELFCEKGFLTQNAIGSLLDTFVKASVKIKLLAKMATFFFDSKIFTLKDFSDLYKEEISWSGYFDVFDKIFELYFEQDFYTVLLLGTSSLERILGCIIFTIHKETFLIPNLIRDLLISPPLVQALGKDIIFYLRCLIGPPSSMNLRNVLWHGFICSKEFLPIPAKWYSALIIITIMSICHKVRKEGGIDSLTRRKGANLEGFYNLPFKSDNFRDDDDNCDKKKFENIYESCMYEQAFPPLLSHCKIVNLVLQNFFILPSTHSTWSRSLYFLSKNQYLLFHILSLPLFECCLRRIFICVNKGVQEHRMNTVVGQYFLTLDVISEKNISCAYFGEKESVGKNPENLIYDEFGGGAMDLILDLFIHFDGPRLRDRIAHGEANHLILSSSSNPLYSYFIGLLILLWTKYRIKFTNVKSKDNNIDENGLNDDYDNSQTINNTYENWISHYQSRFHPIPMLWKECTQLISNIWKCWKVTEMITNKGRFILGDWIELTSNNDLGVSKIESNTESIGNSTNDNNETTKTCTQSNARLNNLFEQQFLMEIVKENNIANVIQNCCVIFKLNKCENNNVNNAKETIYWCQRDYTKEDAKFINIQRVVINKANDGVEKLQNILESIHTSTSLSSRKRKNVQSLFTLFPSMLQQLYFALKCLYTQEYSTSSLAVSKQQKYMLAVLVFIERWCGHCLEAKWKNIAEVFEVMKETIKK